MSRSLNAMFCCVSASLLLSACGNKGDLFLVQDQISAQEVQQLERIVNTDNIPSAAPVEMDDATVYEEKPSAGTQTPQD